jgi:hypothetical protein
LQGYSNSDSKGLQAVFSTTRHAPALSRHAHPAYSVIEEIVEGFVEGILGISRTEHDNICAAASTRSVFLTDKPSPTPEI